MIRVDQLQAILTSLEAQAGAVTSAAANEAGQWLRIARAAETLSSTSSVANQTVEGYMLRAAKALEAVAGTTGTEEAVTYDGIIKRIYDALEVQAGAVTGNTPENRVATAAANAIFFAPGQLFTAGKKGAWFDPSDLTSLKQLSNGTTAVAVGDPVGYMADKSGNNNHAIQTTAGSRPILRQDAQGKYYLETSLDSMNVPTISLSASMDLFIAGQVDAARDKWIMASPVAPVGDKYLGFIQNSTPGPTSVGSGSPTTAVDGKPLTEVPWDAFSAINADTKRTIEIMGANMSTWASLLLGNYATNFQWDGRFYGILLAESQPASRTNMRTFLQGKMGWTASLGALMALGDSITAAGNGHTFSALSQVSSSYRKLSLASGGDTSAAQGIKFDGTGVGKFARAVIIQTGINDLGGSAAAVISGIQALVNKVRAGSDPNTKILVSKMTPLLASAQGVHYSKWLLANEAIAGGGATPITGVDGRITAHEAILNDGAGNLKAIYERATTPDGLHQNDAGLTVIANAWQDALSALGVL